MAPRDPGYSIFALCFNVRFEVPARENRGECTGTLGVQRRGEASPPPFILPGRVPGLAMIGRLGSDTNPHGPLPASDREHGTPRRAVV